MTEIYFTSDLHIGHRNIIAYSKRYPFAPIEEIESGNISKESIFRMNEGLVERWNSVIKPNDIIYNLGDFSFQKFKEDKQKLFNRLNGIKKFIPGNHDDNDTKSLGWNSVSPYMEITIDGKMIVMCHYAFKTWNKSHRGSINLYGHSHGSLPGNSQQLDVGVDCWDYIPVNFEQIKERLKTLPLYSTVDHHKVTKR